MMPSVVHKLPPAQKKRFEDAHNDPKKPIGWWDRDDIAVGLVQAWLHWLGYSLPISTKKEPGGVAADGIFGTETWQAVVAFQKDSKIKPDGMVGHDTLSKLTEALRKRFPDPPLTRNAGVTVVSRPYRCPPGAFICKDPAAE
jgi:hypothetical protein